MGIKHPELVEIINSLALWAHGQETAVARADAAMTAQLQLQEGIARLAEIKATAMREMWETGWSFREIGEALGISGSRVEQIVKR